MLNMCRGFTLHIHFYEQNQMSVRGQLYWCSANLWGGNEDCTAQFGKNLASSYAFIVQVTLSQKVMIRVWKQYEKNFSVLFISITDNICRSAYTRIILYDINTYTNVFRWVYRLCLSEQVNGRNSCSRWIWCNIHCINCIMQFINHSVEIISCTGN
jgi:hypothetical protein